MKFFTYAVIISVLFLYQVYLETGMLLAKHSSLSFSHDIAHFSGKAFFHLAPSEIKKDVLIITKQKENKEIDKYWISSVYIQ